jgi:hypothetical protein
MRKHEESDLQISCVKWFKYSYKEPNYLICTFPNGGNRNIVTATIMKAEGARAGMPDLMVILKGKVFFIEMKSKAGKQSEHQKEIEKILTAMGYKYYICNSFEGFKQMIEHEISRN